MVPVPKNKHAVVALKITCYYGVMTRIGGGYIMRRGQGQTLKGGEGVG